MAIASGLLAAMVVAVFAVLIASIGQLREAATLSQRSEEVIAEANELESLALELQSGMRGYLISRDDRFLKAARDARQRFPEQSATLNSSIQAPSIRQRALRVEGMIQSYIDEWQIPLLELGRTNLGKARALVGTGEGQDRLDAIRRQFDRIVEDENQLDRTREAREEDEARQAVVIGAGGVLGSAMLIVLFAVYLARSVARPVRSVAAAAAQLGGGDGSVRVPVQGRGEIAALGGTFNELAAALETNRRAIEVQKKELEGAVSALSREKDRAESFFRFGEELSSEVETQNIGEMVLRALCDLGAAEVGTLYAVDGALEDGLSLIAARGVHEDLLSSELRPGEGLPGRALVEGRTVMGDHSDGGFILESFGRSLPVRRELHLPLLQGMRVLGVVSLARIADCPFSDQELEALEHLADQSAVALANALSFQSAQHHASVNQAVLDTAHDAFITMNASGTIVAWNSQAEKTFGWTRAEAIGRYLQETIIPERFREAHSRGLAHYLASGEGPVLDQQIELVGLHRDGHEFPVELTISPLGKGSSVTFNAFLRDITERKRGEKYTSAQHAVARVLAEAGTSEDARPLVLKALGEGMGWEAGCIWGVDVASNTLKVEEQWNLLDEADMEEFRSMTEKLELPSGRGLPGRVWQSGQVHWIDDVLEDDNFPRRAAAIQAGLRGAVAFPITGEKGILGVVEFFVREVQRSHPGMMEVLATTGTQLGQFFQRKRAEQEAERVKDEFIALVSHELRTPLTSIIGYQELLLEGEAGPLSAEQRRFLEVVDRNAKRLLHLVGDLLFVARFEAGKPTIEPKIVELRNLASESVLAARPFAEQKRVELNLVRADVPACWGDPHRLAQTFDNLISNALKFTPEGGKVDVELSTEGRHAVIEVSDTGVGIPISEQNLLFERFFRASTATKRAIQGAGLGLTIVKAIVEAHGGTISVTSEAGTGTTFRVQLPLRPPDGANEHFNEMEVHA